MEQDLADDGMLTTTAATVAEDLRSAEDILPFIRVDNHVRARLAFVDPSRDLDADPPPDINTIIDSDRDGLVNASDNCPLTDNPGQEDTGGSEYGDACDAHFADLAADHSPGYVCGVHAAGSNRPEGSIECFIPTVEGIPAPLQRYAPDPGTSLFEQAWVAAGRPTATAITMAYTYACILTPDGHARCWHGTTEVTVPDLVFAEVQANYGGFCGRTNALLSDTLQCFRPGFTGPAISGRFIDMGTAWYGGSASGRPVVCAVEQTTRALRCWNGDTGAELSYPAGWPATASHVDDSCVILDDGSIDWFQINAAGTAITSVAAAPLVHPPYTQVTCNRTICGLTADGVPDCGGTSDMTYIPYGTFVHIANRPEPTGTLPDVIACGLTDEGRARCFGENVLLEQLYTPW